jgi:hypothetical protein
MGPNFCPHLTMGFVCCPSDLPDFSRRYRPSSQSLSLLYAEVLLRSPLRVLPLELRRQNPLGTATVDSCFILSLVFLNLRRLYCMARYYLRVQFISYLLRAIEVGPFELSPLGA